MNGLLHRLAARAAGTAVTVRSDVRLPFADTRLGAEPAEQQFEHADAGCSAPPPSAAGPPVAAVVGNASRPVECSSVVRPSAGADMNLAMSDPVRLTATIEPSRLMAQHGLTQLTASSVESTLEPNPLPATPSSSRAGSTAPSDLPQALRIEPLMASTLQPPATASLFTQPALLMPPATSAVELAHHTATPTAVIPAIARSQVVDRNEPNEVHIHIGRIEVTAVHEGMAPRRRAAQQAASLSLEQYFAKRGRG